MTRLYILLFVIASLIGKGQAKLEMSPIHSFSPANANTPASSVTYSSTVNLTVYVKNTGNAAFSGSFAVMARRDTIGGVFLDSLHMSSLLFQVGDSIQVPLSFSPTSGAGAFKVAGNGNTIVVWPIASNAIIGDSLRSTVWVNNDAGIKEIEKGNFNVYPNPIINELHIKPYDKQNYKTIIVYDVFARKIKEMNYQEIIDLSQLTPGNYWIVISTDSKSYRIPIIKE